MTDIPSDPARIEARLSAVRAVGNIVRALWAISRAQLGQVEQFAREASAYLDWVDEIKLRIAGPASTEPQREDPLVVLLGPERPFCAGLPGEVLRALPAVPRIGLVGRRLVAATQSARGRRVLQDAALMFELPGPTSIDDLDEVAENLAAAILEHGEARAVTLLHPAVGRTGLRRVELLAGRQAPTHSRDFESYSTQERLLQYAVRESITGNLRVALAETLRVEVRARAQAAESAKRAVERRSDTLEAALRIRQQEQTTSELAELFAGQLHLRP